MKSEELALVAALLRGQRQAALGTLSGGAPFTSMVAYVAEPDFGGVLLHLSQLAPHTRHLLVDSRASLLISESDDGRDDVQTLARITLVGAATPLAEPEYATARELYLARLPASAPLFEFPDFALFRLVPDEARYIGGFGRVFSLSVEQLRQASRL